MKTALVSKLFASIFVFAGIESAYSSVFVQKLDNSIPLESGSSWNGGNAPPYYGGGAIWDSRVSANNTAAPLGLSVSWAGIEIYNPGADVLISGPYTLNIGYFGIDMSGASRDLIMNCNLGVGVSHSWYVASGRKLTIGGSVYAGGNDLTVAGEGVIQIGNGSSSGAFMQAINVAVVGGTLAFSRAGTIFQQATISGNVNSSMIINNSTTAGNLNTIPFADGMNLFGTIKNSAVGTLAITGSQNCTNTLGGSGSGNGLVNSAAGSLIVNGGTWTLTNSVLNSGGNNSGTIVINSGLVSADFVNSSNGGAANFAGNLTINGGVLHITSGRLSMAATDSQKLTINGGQVIVDNTSGGNFAGVQLGGDSGATGTGISFVGIQTNGIVSQPNTSNAASFDLGSSSLSKTTSYTLAGGSVNVGGGQSFRLGADSGGTGTTALILTNKGNLSVSGTILGIQVGAKQVFQFRGGTLVAMALDLTNLRDSAANLPGNLVNAGGTLSPGGSDIPGKTTITGNYTINPGQAAFAVDIGGQNPAATFQDSASTYDVIAVTGNVALNGNLIVKLINGFTPGANDTFTIVTASNLAGTFLNLDVSNRVYLLGENWRSFHVAITQTKVVLDDFESAPPPIVSVSPSTWNAECGSSCNFAVSAVGVPPITYQWYNPSTNIMLGETNSSLTLTNVHAGQAGNYTVVASNGPGSTSTSATLSVTDTVAPVITINGASFITNWIYEPFVDLGAVAVDACAGSVSVITNGTVDTNAAGTYTIQYIATDGVSHFATNARSVFVIKPSIVSGAFVGVPPVAFRLTMIGPTNKGYAILATSNLIQPMSNWSIIGTGTFRAQPTTIFNDRAFTTNPIRYYRIVPP